MTLVNFRNEVDSRLANLWPQIVTRQENHFANRSRFWQGGWTVPTIPACVTADSAFPDTPTDAVSVVASEVGSWGAVAGFPAQMCYRVRMDVWEDADGTKGFTGIVQVRFNGTIYERLKSYPDDRFTEPWATRKD